jgi:phage shock protein PspC (stress-responsive transcriptional regulator)
MDKTIVISLTGHAGQYRLEQDAYDRLSRYLHQAALGLPDDPDRAEVLGDLERSVGDKLDVLLAPGDRLVTGTDIDGVLEAIGAVDTGQGPVAGAAGSRPSGRHLYRIVKGKQTAGVCTGLAAYADVDVSWVRTFFVLGSLGTAGILGLVYIALAFVLPVAETRGAELHTRRRLSRLQDGKQIAGVCAGLAAYSELRVDWVRTLFVFAALLTAGLFGLVYAALVFLMPVASTREA